jgi:glycosyltransferase involved in cell wall biosynthesis
MNREPVKDRPWKVLALVPALHNTSPGQRYRLEQWARHWPREAIDLTYVPFEDAALHDVLYQRGQMLRKAAGVGRGFLRRLRLLSHIRRFDLVYVFREAALLGPALLERLIHLAGVPMIFDFDDAVWVPYVSPTNRYWSYLKCFGKTATLCRLSAHVLAGNPYLADYARRVAADVSIVPSTIDTDLYPRPTAGAERSGPVTIGWTGSHSTVQHLDTIRPVLTRLRARMPFRLGVVGTNAYDLPGVDVNARPWNAASEVADLAHFDIGIMPLPDDEWSKGKCGMKLLQYMALGIPVVGARVGVNGDIIEDGVNGFLASNDDEWLDRLTRLIGDAKLRERLGRAGRETVEQRYSAHVWAPRVRAIFEEVGRLRATHANT